MCTVERGLHIQDVLNGIVSSRSGIAPPKKHALSKGHQTKMQLQYCSGTSRLSSSQQSTCSVLQRCKSRGSVLESRIKFHSPDEWGSWLTSDPKGSRFFFLSAPVAFRRVALETPEWTSRDSNHHRQSVSAGKTNAIPTEPSGRLSNFTSDFTNLTTLTSTTTATTTTTTTNKNTTTTTKQLQLQLYDCNYTTLITLHHNYNSTTLQLQLQLQYITLHPPVVDEVTTANVATIPANTTPTTFRSISGFALPSVIHNNQRLLWFPILKLPPLPCGATGNEDVESLLTLATSVT